MARKRANDYDDKRQAILDRSAKLFSAHGYDRASMSKIADACGVSKANLYHYYKDKEGLLFDVIRFHLGELLEVVEAADHPDQAPEARLRGLIAALLEDYRDADSQHNVQISSMRFLPQERQAELRGIDEATLEVVNGSCAEYWLLVVAGGSEVEGPPADEGGDTANNEEGYSAASAEGASFANWSL